MSWDDGNDNKDPWRPRGKEGPADLDAIVRDLHRKLRGFFGGGRRDDGGEDRGPQPGMGSGLLSFGLVIVLALWAATGFYIVDEAERGVVLRFGKYSTITMPGLRWHLPMPIEQVETINTNEVVAWPYQGRMLTRDENIVVINLEVQYVRRNPEDYLFNLVDPEETLKDVTASAIREIVGKNDLEYILGDGRLDIADKALQLIQSTLDSYGTGIEVILLPMDEGQYPEEVQPSVQDVNRAREDRDRAMAVADRYRNQVIPSAQGQAVRQIEDAAGYRSRVIADAEGETRRFSQILTEYQLAPAVTRERIFLETLESILANSTKILVDTEGGSNLLYLPLDQLMQRAPTSNTSPTGVTTVPAANVDSVPASRTPAVQRNPR